MREPLPLSVPDTLVRWEPGQEPVVSCLIDWRVDGTVREARTLVARRLREEYRTLNERSPARISLEEDASEIETFLATQADPAAIAYAVFASHGRGLWYTTAVGVPVETAVYVGEYPRLVPLLEATRDAARTLVVVANTNSARLIRLAPSGPVELHGPHREIATVQHSTEGGWGALNYQRHIDVEVARFAQLLGEAIVREMAERDLQHLVVSGDTVIVPPLLAALPKGLRERVDAIEHFERWESTREIAGAVWPVVAELVRARREAEVSDLLGRAAGGHEALSVAAEVAAAAASGRVDTLALDPDVVDIAAAETLVREALRHRSRVNVARGHGELAEAGGVVASLR